MSIPCERTPMKRIFPLFLLLALLLTSCIPSQIAPPSVTDETTGVTLPTPPAPSMLEGFFNSAITAQAFLTADGVVDASEREYSYDEMTEDLHLLAAAYPKRFTVESLGTSVAGRTLWLGILGNQNAPRQIVVSAGIHGREYLTPLLAMKQIEFYLAYYDVGTYAGIPYATLFDSCCFYIVPMSNPDGVMLSQQGLASISNEALRAQIEAIYQADLADGLTSQEDVDSFLQYWKANAAGVDLNRNFDALWAEYQNISRPCCVQYKGPYAASEPETQALVKLMRRLPNVRAVLCIHSQGEVLYWNCGQNEELKAQTLAFTQAIAKRNGYKIMTEQNNDASFSDFCALREGVIAVTVETGKGVCPLDVEKFVPIWEDNFDLLVLSAAYFYQ